MDTARAAKRTEGVEHVYLVYRRTKRYMPAAEDELLEVLEEGIEFRELLSPVSLENGRLFCKKMVLGNMDASGRASVTETDETVEVPADTVIVAVGEKCRFLLAAVFIFSGFVKAVKPASMTRQWRQV